MLATCRKQRTEVPVEPAVIEAMEEAFRGFEAAGPSESWEERFRLAEGTAQEVLDQALHSLLIANLEPHALVHAEARVLPGEPIGQQLKRMASSPW